MTMQNRQKSNAYFYFLNLTEQVYNECMYILTPAVGWTMTQYIASLIIDFLPCLILFTVLIIPWNSWLSVSLCSYVRLRASTVKLAFALQIFHFSIVTCWWGGVELSVGHLDVWSVSHEFKSSINAPIVSLSKKVYPYCLVLVGLRNGFKCDLHWGKLLVYKYELK